MSINRFFWEISHILAISLEIVKDFEGIPIIDVFRGEDSKFAVKKYRKMASLTIIRALNEHFSNLWAFLTIFYGNLS